ncbi:MAG: DUF2254 family protein [Kofleriaceae bacterium]
MARVKVRRGRATKGSTLRLWLGPVTILGGIATLAFAAFYAIDHHVTGGVPEGKTRGLLEFEPTLISDALPGLAGLTAAMLGIVITVVSLLVQLTSDRYTGVARMFLRDRTNVAVMSFYVVTCVVGVFLSLSLHADFVPRATVVAMMIATGGGIVIMLPYFAYVFRFLEPVNLIARIQAEAAVDLREASTSRHGKELNAGQVHSITALEELTDITSNSISGKDKIIASRAVDAIKDFVVDYLDIKHRVQPSWHHINEGIAGNPDFVAMDPESLRDLEAEKTWLEWKALRQYLGIYAEAQNDMPDINYLIAIDTRYIGEAALAKNDNDVLDLAFRFMNSYLRAALNARAVRTAYNVMNQYRLMVESMVRGGASDMAITGVRHMIYYGRTSYDMQLGFVTETVAWDVAALCEYAHTQAGKSVPADLDDKMLAMFLELDQPLRVKRQESGLQGIRKAQIKLACYYLSVGAVERARKIAKDMEGEDRERLWTIREQLVKVESKEFWEIIDRGRNFEFMPANQREQMDRFYDLLPPLPRPSSKSIPPPVRRAPVGEEE